MSIVDLADGMLLRHRGAPARDDPTDPPLVSAPPVAVKGSANGKAAAVLDIGFLGCDTKASVKPKAELPRLPAETSLAQPRRAPVSIGRVSLSRLRRLAEQTTKLDVKTELAEAIIDTYLFDVGGYAMVDGALAECIASDRAAVAALTDTTLPMQEPDVVLENAAGGDGDPYLGLRPIHLRAKQPVPRRELVLVELTRRQARTQRRFADTVRTVFHLAFRLAVGETATPDAADPFSPDVVDLLRLDGSNPWVPRPVAGTMTRSAFAAAVADRGLTPPALIADEPRLVVIKAPETVLHPPTLKGDALRLLDRIETSAFGRSIASDARRLRRIIWARASTGGEDTPEDTEVPPALLEPFTAAEIDLPRPADEPPAPDRLEGATVTPDPEWTVADDRDIAEALAPEPAGTRPCRVKRQEQAKAVRDEERDLLLRAVCERCPPLRRLLLRLREAVKQRAASGREAARRLQADDDSQLRGIHSASAKAQDRAWTSFSVNCQNDLVASADAAAAMAPSLAPSAPTSALRRLSVVRSRRRSTASSLAVDADPTGRRVPTLAIPRARADSSLEAARGQRQSLFTPAPLQLRAALRDQDEADGVGDALDDCTRTHEAIDRRVKYLEDTAGARFLLVPDEEYLLGHDPEPSDPLRRSVLGGALARYPPHLWRTDAALDDRTAVGRPDRPPAAKARSERGPAALEIVREAAVDADREFREALPFSAPQVARTAERLLPALQILVSTRREAEAEAGPAEDAVHYETLSVGRDTAAVVASRVAHSAAMPSAAFDAGLPLPAPKQPALAIPTRAPRQESGERWQVAPAVAAGGVCQRPKAYRTLVHTTFISERLVTVRTFRRMVADRRVRLGLPLNAPVFPYHAELVRLGLVPCNDPVTAAEEEERVIAEEYRWRSWRSTAPEARRATQPFTELTGAVDVLWDWRPAAEYVPLAFVHSAMRARWEHLVPVFDARGVQTTYTPSFEQPGRSVYDPAPATEDWQGIRRAVVCGDTEPGAQDAGEWCDDGDRPLCLPLWAAEAFAAAFDLMLPPAEVWEAAMRGVEAHWYPWGSAGTTLPSSEALHDTMYRAMSPSVVPYGDSTAIREAMTTADAAVAMAAVKDIEAMRRDAPTFDPADDPALALPPEVLPFGPLPWRVPPPPQSDGPRDDAAPWSGRALEPWQYSTYAWSSSPCGALDVYHPFGEWNSVAPGSANVSYFEDHAAPAFPSPHAGDAPPVGLIRSVYSLHEGCPADTATDAEGHDPRHRMHPTGPAAFTYAWPWQNQAVCAFRLAHAASPYGADRHVHGFGEDADGLLSLPQEATTVFTTLPLQPRPQGPPRFEHFVQRLVLVAAREVFSTDELVHGIVAARPLVDAAVLHRELDSLSDLFRPMPLSKLLALTGPAAERIDLFDDALRTHRVDTSRLCDDPPPAAGPVREAVGCDLIFAAGFRLRYVARAGVTSVAFHTPHDVARIAYHPVPPSVAAAMHALSPALRPQARGVAKPTLAAMVRAAAAIVAGDTGGSEWAAGLDIPALLRARPRAVAVQCTTRTAADPRTGATTTVTPRIVFSLATADRRDVLH